MADEVQPDYPAPEPIDLKKYAALCLKQAGIEPTRDDVDATASAILKTMMGRNANDKERSREYGGYLYKTPDGEICASVPVGGEAAGSVEFKIPKDVIRQTMGIYHNHPGQQESMKYFSPTDVDTQKAISVKLKRDIPSYIGLSSQDQIYRLDEEDTRKLKPSNKTPKAMGTRVDAKYDPLLVQQMAAIK